METHPPTPLPTNNTPSKAGATPLFVLAAIAAIGLCVVGGLLAARGAGWTMLAAGCGCVVGVIVAGGVARLIESARSQSAAAAERTLTGLHDRLDQLNIMLAQMSENQLLSDRAKSVAYRQKDSEALRRAIREEMSREHWDAASVLVADMERAFGYKAEADQFREEIAAAREANVRKQIGEAAGEVDRLVREKHWKEAAAEAARLATVFPSSDVVRALPREIEMRRDAHRRRLIDDLAAAAGRHDVDGAIALIKQVDLCLTHAEAEPLQETVRAVFKEKLANLKTQFSLAWQEQDYPAALTIAESVVADFPNSGMAREMRDMLPTIQARAAGERPAEAAAT